MSKEATKLCIAMLFEGYKPTKAEHDLIVHEVQDELYVVDAIDIEKEYEIAEYDRFGVLISFKGTSSYKRDVKDHTVDKSLFGDTVNRYRKKSQRVPKKDYPMTNKVWVKPKHILEG